MEPRIHIVAGHFGSGKTEFSLNLALRLAREGRGKVRLFDFDFINPYFRSRRFRAQMAAEGVEVVEPASREVASADIPSISAGVLSAVGPGEDRAVIEVGGDPVGARVLATVAERVRGRGCLFQSIFNPFRPDTDTRDKVIEMTRRIEAVARLETASLVVNPHLKEETGAETLLAGLAFAREVERDFLPVRYFCALEGTALPPEVAEGPYEIFRLRKFNAYCHEDATPPPRRPFVPGRI